MCIKNTALAARKHQYPAGRTILRDSILYILSYSQRRQMNNKYHYALFTVESSEFLRAPWLLQHPSGRLGNLCPLGRQLYVKTRVIHLTLQETYDLHFTYPHNNISISRTPTIQKQTIAGLSMNCYRTKIMKHSNTGLCEI